MKSILALLILSATCLFAAEPAGEKKPFQEQLIPLMKAARELRAKHNDKVTGKLGDLLARLEKIDPGADGGGQERLMWLGLLAELQSLDGQYDRSNESYGKAYALQPNFGYCRKMVVNMRLKGDMDAAKAVVEQYRAVLMKEHPGDDQAARRQDLLQFVESALKGPLPRR